MAANEDFDQILSTTLDNYRPTLTDNVTSATPLLDFLKRKDKIRMLGGGATIVEPIMHALNSTAKPYSGWDVLDITPQEGISAAQYPWKQFAASVAINGIEEAVNSGREAVINLLEAKVQQAEMTIAEVMNEMLFGDGVNYQGTPNTKAWNGLELLVGTDAVGGIDPATAGNEFWQSYVGDGGGSWSDSEWARAFYTVSRGSDSPDFAITSQELFQEYEESLMAQLRFTDNAKADSRFRSLDFKGIPIFFDVYCPTDRTYFLNSKYIQLVGHKDKWMKNTKFRETPDVDGRWAQILSYGNFTIRNRARQAVVTGQTA
jgi:hypothetical protein